MTASATNAPTEALADAEFNRLLEVALLAVDERRFHEAEQLLDALHRLRPGSPYPQIGQALIAHGQHRLVNAIDTIESVLLRFPNAVFTRGLLARFLYEAGHADWLGFAAQAFQLASNAVEADTVREVLGAELTAICNADLCDTDHSLTRPIANRRLGHL